MEHSTKVDGRSQERSLTGIPLMFSWVYGQCRGKLRIFIDTGCARVYTFDRH